ncbi:hypothetical protein [Phaeovulum sp.]|uniref:hypothetical protein n=1 Tax=Phaeovulum sp. TaxID=2934796 RepID=UPI0039E6E79B
MPQIRRVGLDLPVLAALAAGAGFVALQLWAFTLAGVFEYPLDDVYIHLAMAANMVQGTYGINAGEPASAASSILYPVLLMPFAGTEVQRLLPLLWNGVALVFCGWLWGRALVMGGLSGGVGVALALLGPLALNMPGVGYTGMEHTLHTAASLATVLGLAIFLREGRVAPWFVLAVVVAPLFRLEGLALSLLAAGVVAVRGQLRSGVMLGLAVVVPVLAFAAFLMGLGLAPLPGSVLAKVGLAAPLGSGLMRLVMAVKVNLSTPPGQLLAVLTMLCALLPLALSGRRRPEIWLLAVVAVAGVAHLLAGQIGWMHRYEHYIIAAQITAMVISTKGVTGPRAAWRWRAMLGFLLAIAALAFWPKVAQRYIWNTRAVYLQQTQMGRFVQGWLKAPVAINDLGRIAWGNPDYVLDLYGLASPKVLELRLSGDTPKGWAAPLAQSKGAQMAIIYDRWFETAMGPDWRRLAVLRMDPYRGALGGGEVSFYATDPSLAPAQLALLRDFAPTLPAGAYLSFEAGTQ